MKPTQLEKTATKRVNVGSNSELEPSDSDQSQDEEVPPIVESSSDSDSGDMVVLDPDHVSIYIYKVKSIDNLNIYIYIYRKQIYMRICLWPVSYILRYNIHFYNNHDYTINNDMYLYGISTRVTFTTIIIIIDANNVDC